ncbi:universal stress protein [Nocardioides sp.]|uniref:universal stress protein n=1 Tax=Nocardioides sp. TaxID=35761 RepID=UPI002ED4892B
MTLVVGFPPGKDDWSPIELGATLARSVGTDLLVVSVVPTVWPTPVAGGTDREYEVWAEQHGAAAVAEANAILAEVCPDVAAVVRWTPGRSIASTLLEQAEEIEAGMIVVGSGSTGSYGRVHPGSIGDWLLHSSHIPVAVATHDYVGSEHGRLRRVSCAFRGDDRSLQTMERTAAICADIGASLRLVTFAVRGRTVYTAGVGVQAEDVVLDRWVDQATAAQAEALRLLKESENAPSEVDSVVSTGRSWGAAIDRLDWDRDEVLVVGSSSASVIERIFLGSNASKILRHSPVPVVVVP